MMGATMPAHTFEETDLFDLSSFANRLEFFIQEEHFFVDGSLVLSLEAPFGSGKSTFLEMWVNRLQTKLESGGEGVPVVPILLNAWQDDYYGDALVALLHAFTSKLGSVRGEPAQAARIKKMKDAAKDVAWFIVGLGNALAGGAPGEAGKLAEEKHEARTPRRPDFIKLFGEKQKAISDLKAALSQVFDGQHLRALVVVDELDRCRPDYAVQYLEAIKHVFDIPGLTFVLGVDIEQLKCSVKTLFGDLNFQEYYRKFAHRNIPLPQPEKNEIANLVNHYIERYVHGSTAEGISRKTRLKLDSDMHGILVQTISVFHLTPRQVQDAFRILGHLTAKAKDSYSQINWGIASATIFVLGIKSTHPSLYDRFKKGEPALHEIAELIKARIPDHDQSFWISVLAAGLFKRNSDWQIARTALALNGAVDSQSDEQVIKDHLRDYSRGWGGFSVKDICLRIEALLDYEL
jgi:hypothetical protein